MSTEEKVYTQETKDAYDRLFDTFESVQIPGITILTGTNGSGKSLIRKQIPFRMKEYLSLDNVKETQGLVKSVSMELRTKSQPSFGALSSMCHDTEWIATSQNTYHSLQQLFKAISDKDSKTKYIIIDEFEIGCGEETILALTEFLNENIKRLIDTTELEGALIITHSRIGVKELYYDSFLNIEGLTAGEWLNREITPTDLDVLDENELFSYVRDHQHGK